MKVIAKWTVPFLLLLLFKFVTLTNSREFNYEVEKRILDRLSFYLGDLVQTNEVVANYRKNGLFDSDLLLAFNRRDYLRFAYSLPQPLLYFGLENGQFAGYPDRNVGSYREPGNSGYDINDPNMKKHYESCVDSYNGDPTKCTLAPGDSYIQCLQGDDCTEVIPCPDEKSQQNCAILAFNDDRKKCFESVKHCIQYTIQTVPLEDTQDNTVLGMIPITDLCHDQYGRFSQDLGVIVDKDGSDKLGNCYYKDGKTLVQRNLAGDYAHCGLNGEICNTTFVGGYDSGNYDPRYRPWYIVTKELQVPNWSPPYPFFHLGMGITYSHPVYSEMDGKQVFMGVLAVDFRFEDIGNFLEDNYGGTGTIVAIFEDAEPNYVIGLSTASPAINLKLKNDVTQPCPVDSGISSDCKPVRVAMADLQGTEEDDVLVRAFFKQREVGYPRDLVSVKVNDNVDSDLYVSQSTLYEESGANLRWRIIIVEPGNKNTTDAILPSATLFSAVVVVSGIGFLCCMMLLFIFYGKRQERAVIHADWRFTCAFIFGCALFNLATLTRLGPNTDEMCIIRMWSFHLLFVIALAPLFVKIWRMQKLVGSTNIRRVTITNTQTAMYMLPIILVQVAILLTITFVDPPKQTEIIETIGGTVSQRIVCQAESSALFIIEFVFEAGFIVAGCVLAFMTRNMDQKYGESKQLIFAMYNIALVGMIIVIVTNIGGINPNGTSVLMVVGVFWGTVFSSAAFVLPRMLEARQEVQRVRNVALTGPQMGRRKTTTYSNRVQVSGLESSLQPSQLSHVSEQDSEDSDNAEIHASLQFDDKGSEPFSSPTKSSSSARDRKRVIETDLTQLKVSVCLKGDSINGDIGATHPDVIDGSDEN